MTDTDLPSGEPPDDKPDKPEDTYSLARLQRFLTKRKVADHCPMCSTTTWHKATDERFKHYIPTLELTSGVPAIVLVCSNCGFIRMHATIIIDVEENFSGESALTDPEKT